DALARIDITAQTPIGRMPQRPLARELGVLDLAHELGRAPVRCRVRAHITCERRLRHLALLECREQLAEGALVEARPDVTEGHELVVAVETEQQRSQRREASALTFGP